MAVTTILRVARLNRGRLQGPWRWQSGAAAAAEAEANERRWEGAGAADTEEAARAAVLDAALPFVGVHGWSRQTCAQGARGAGLPSSAHALFPSGGADLALAYTKRCDARLTEALAPRALPPDTPADRRRRFLQEAVELRLGMVAGSGLRWAEAQALLALPSHAPHALQALMAMADDVCHLAGDRAVDFSWYAHRAAVASIYKAAEIYLLQDSSEDYSATRAFAERLLDAALAARSFLPAPGAVGGVGAGTAPPLPEVAGAAFTTVRNMLGLNGGSR